MKILLFIIPFILNAAIYLEKPDDFKPKFEIIGCFIEDGNKILFLHRQDEKRQGNTWAIPGGKIESNETPIVAASREVFEETGFTLKDWEYLGKVYIKYCNYDFIYHMVRAKAPSNPGDVKIRFVEHKGFTWVTAQDALLMNLMPDEDDCIKLIYPDVMKSNENYSAHTLRN